MSRPTGLRSVANGELFHVAASRLTWSFKRTGLLEESSATGPTSGTDASRIEKPAGYVRDYFGVPGRGQSLKRKVASDCRTAGAHQVIDAFRLRHDLELRRVDERERGRDAATLSEPVGPNHMDSWHSEPGHHEEEGRPIAENNWGLAEVNVLLRFGHGASLCDVSSRLDGLEHG